MRRYRCAFAFLCCALLCPPSSALAAETSNARHSLWSLQGRDNIVYLLGSVHFLKESEQLPAAIDAAYADAETLVMELDMDDLDSAQVQRLTLELGVLPPGESLEQQLGPPAYEQLLVKARQSGLDATLLARLRPWFAAMTLVQLQLMKMGLDPAAGVESRLARRAAADSKPILGLETPREQFEMLANLPDELQREFLLYSVEDADRMTRELDDLLAAWRRGDADAMAAVLAEGFQQHPGLYRPLTVERNRRWLPELEELLDDRDDYLVVVGALHLVGRDSIIELLERKGHKVRQH